MSKGIIEPKILKGFRDTLPQMAITRGEMIKTIETVFTSFGFAPIDTPAIEYAEILLGKGSDEHDKQMYRFMDNGERDVSLRFDLTVPFARFAAMHINDMGTPFKRYHIAPVWRAEKPQRGRYREFVQCDIDTIGTTSVLADAEILLVHNKALRALDINHRIRINDRVVLNGLLSKLGRSEKTGAVLRAIDKLDKLGKEVVTCELVEEAGLSEAGIDEIFSFLAITENSPSTPEVLNTLKNFFAGNEIGLRGVNNLETIATILDSAGVKQENYCIDLSIARGLDYYTGTVFETKLLDIPNFGSISAGGRYDNLASLYTKRELPGVGGSIGLDRIIGAMEELKRLSSRISTARVLVSLMSYDELDYTTRLAESLRAQGLGTEMYLEPTKLGNQFKYAEKKGIEVMVIVGSTEKASNTANIKLLSSGEQLSSISFEDVGKNIKSLLQKI